MYQIDNDFDIITGGRHVDPPIDPPYVHQVVWFWNPFETNQTVGPMCDRDVQRVWAFTDFMLRTQFPFWLDYVDEPDLATILRQHPPITGPRTHWVKYPNHKFYRSVNEVKYAFSKASQAVMPWWYRSDIDRTLLNRVGQLCGFRSWKSGPKGRAELRYTKDFRIAKTWGAFGEPLLDILERMWRGMSRDEILYGVRQVQPMIAQIVAEMRSM